MLGKLMKYEFKATSRWFLPLYAAIILIAIINRILFVAGPIEVEGGFSNTIKQIIQVISIIVYVMLMIGTMTVTLVVVIQRFYKSLLGDEGYLMFTLPVASWKHILNKLLIAMLWNFVSGLVAFGSILIMLTSKQIAQILDAFREFGQYMGTAGYFTVPLLLLLSLFFSIVLIYAAIALGHLFNKHKLLASFGMYLGLNTICQFFMMLMLPFIMNTMIKSLEANVIPPPSQINALILVTILLTVLLSAGCFILTDRILKTKLNLE